MQQLEILAYESPGIQKGKQVIYRVSDLESLSTIALYYGDGSSSGSGSGFGGGFGGGRGFFETAYEKGTKKGPSGGGPKPSIEISIPKLGETLPGGLKIKKIGHNTISLQEDLGGVGNLYTVHPDGHGAVRFYGLGEGKAKEKKTNSW